MVWDYVEANPIGVKRLDGILFLNDVINTLSHLTQIPPVEVED
jgi:hypothetical protein